MDNDLCLTHLFHQLGKQPRDFCFLKKSLRTGCAEIWRRIMSLDLELFLSSLKERADHFVRQKNASFHSDQRCCEEPGSARVPLQKPDASLITYLLGL